MSIRCLLAAQKNLIFLPLIGLFLMRSLLGLPITTRPVHLNLALCMGYSCLRPQAPASSHSKPESTPQSQHHSARSQQHRPLFSGLALGVLTLPKSPLHISFHPQAFPRLALTKDFFHPPNR